METELQQAERTAKAWLEWPAVPEVATLARVFLAQQARLAEVERERDRLFEMGRKMEFRAINAESERDNAKVDRQAHIDWLNEQDKELRQRVKDLERTLAAAERKATEAAREALTRLYQSSTYWFKGEMTSADLLRFRDRKYPAPTEREATPPQAAPEPLYLVVEYQGPLGDWRGDAYRTRVRLTPEICRRIVAMAGVPVPEEGGR